MKRTLLILLITTFGSLPALSQQRVPQRERGWNERQTERWLDRIGARPIAQYTYNLGDACLSYEEYTNRRDVIMNGNKITTQIQNFGSISSPGNVITDIVWNGLGYGYEFGPFVLAEVEVDGPGAHPDEFIKRDENGAPVLDDDGNPIYMVHIVSDGIVSNGGETSPDGREAWGWSPVPCAASVGNFDGLVVVNNESDAIPTSDARDRDLDGKPDSWPSAWYNPNLEQFVWPGALQQGASNADQETLYFMNDYNNKEFPYYPFPSDTTKRGLGLEVETRIYQWSNPLAEDALFLVYKISNKSERDLEKVTFGMWGDPHIGGPGDWPDDLAYFDRDLNMVFAWDADLRSDIPGRVPGYFGYKFLESPGLGTEIINGVTYEGDGIDNDEDGLLDESWTDGIDNDGDWNPETDDVGIDGIPGTGDFGEDDGIPTAGDPFDITQPGEPNFEFTDIDESDMIGLTSFVSPGFSGTRIDNDRLVADLVKVGRFDAIPSTPGDYVFIYGSGSFPLRAGETKRFSIALLMGENFEDLRLNAETVQQIFEVGYRFARPPDKPIVRAVPGDQKVTLYWDDRAEQSVDPLSRTQDFEGYVIYRSTDPEFADQQTITDVNGSRFLFRPLTTAVGVEAKFDLVNGITGPSTIPYPRRGVAYDMGDDTGLFHTYVDSNAVVNGQTYYYAVAAYDRGFAPDDGSGGIPPTETSKTVTYNPTTDEYIFDDNTVAVVPRPRAAGYTGPRIGEDGITQIGGFGTGPIAVQIVDEMAVQEAGSYRIEFDIIDGETVYSVVDETPVVRTITALPGKFISVGRPFLVEGSVQVRDGDAVLAEGTHYELSLAQGAIQIIDGSGIAAGTALTVTYNYMPLYHSDQLANQEANPVFDGLHLFVQEDELDLNFDEIGWSQGGAGLDSFQVRVASAGPGRIAQPADYEIRFSNDIKTSSFATNLPLPFEIYNLTNANTLIQSFVADINRDGVWQPNETVIFLEEIDGKPIATWQVRFFDSDRTPGDGEVFYLRTYKPFGEDDAFRFTTLGAGIDLELAAGELEDIYVVPNPYVATNEMEPRNPVSRSERGDRRLYFANVPNVATIRIYTLAGELVDTIEHNSTFDDGKVYWDLRTKDNMNIAYGLYIFHVESEAGDFIGKFAVIK